MTNFTEKNKIYVICAVWLGLCLIMFTYVFKILDNSNTQSVANLADQEHSLQILQAEEMSYRQAQSDLDKVKTEKYQPDDLFSKDVSLVNELKTFESLGIQYGVSLTISGIGGTIKTATKAPTKSNLSYVPYSLNIVGPYANVLELVQRIEHLQFVTVTPTLVIGADTGGNVDLSLTGKFYLRNQ